MKIPDGVARWPDGEPILIVRPKNPRLTRALAIVAVDKQSENAMRAAVEDQPCKFVGFLLRSNMIADADGQNLQPLQEGDIMVSAQEIKLME